jgi:hypothetical protein
MQSLCLAIRLISIRLGNMLDDNENLLYPEDRSVFDRHSLGAIFGGRGPVL